MPKLSETALLARDATRDLNAELLASIADIQAGNIGRVSVVNREGHVINSPVTKARLVSKLPQTQFAELMGVSVRTLQEWEQGRRKPSKAAQTLLRVAELHPEVLRELAAL
jgi:putative transcriptional regulator